MPEIPDVQSLGARPVAAPRRLVTEVETPSVAEQQSLASTPSAVGNILGQQADRVYTRDDAVARAKATRAYATYAQELMTQYETEKDISDKKVLKEFGSSLRAKEQELLGSFNGSMESRADLSIRLGDISSQYSGQMAGQSLKAQQEIADAYMTETQSALSSGVYDDAGSYDTAAAAWDAEVRQMSGVYPGSAELAMSTGGKADLAQTAISGMLDRGDYDAAEQFMMREDISKLLPSAQQRQIRSRVTTQRIAQDRARNELKAQVSMMEEILGGPLSKAQKAKFLGVDIAPGPLTLADQIATAEKVKGGPLSELEMTAAYRNYLGIAGAFDDGTGGSGLTGGDMFGTGIEGRSLEIITRGADGWANNLLDPQEERLFQSALIEYTQPKSYTNPDSGLVETRQPELPPFVKAALAQRPVGEMGLPPMEMPEFQAPNPLEVGSGSGFYNQAENLTGPVASIGRALSRIPVVGDLLPDQVAQFDKVKNEYDLFVNQITSTLRENPKYAEGERRYILDILDIDTSVIDRPERFRNALQGVDDNLAVREQLARSQATNSNISRAERQKAMDILSIIVPIRQKMDVPRKVTSVEEAANLLKQGALRPGQVVRFPDGEEFELPAEITLPSAAGGGSG